MTWIRRGDGAKSCIPCLFGAAR